MEMDRAQNLKLVNTKKKKTLSWCGAQKSSPLRWQLAVRGHVGADVATCQPVHACTRSYAWVSIPMNSSRSSLIGTMSNHHGPKYDSYLSNKKIYIYF